MDIKKSVEIKDRPATYRRSLIWIVIPVLVGLLILSEIAFRTLKKQGWTIYRPTNYGLADNNVNAVAVDGQGRVWVGSDDGGLSVLARDGSWTTYIFANSSLADDDVRAVAVDGQGRVWVGTDSGLSMLAPDGSWTAYTAANSGLADNNVNAVAVDGQGQIWVGTSGGLSLLALDGSWTTYIFDNSGPANDDVCALAVDGQGWVWVLTDFGRGLSVLTPDGSWTTYTLTNSDLADGYVRAVTVDGQGWVWVGTDTGLYVGPYLLAPDASWTTYTVANSSLADDDVRAVTVDGQGRVWVGTSGGLNMLYPDAAMSPAFITPLFYLRRFTIFALIVVAIAWAVQRWRSRPKKFIASQPAAQPMIPSGPVAVLETGSTLERQEQHQQKVDRLLAIYRRGDSIQRQQALAELEKMGEIEEF
jgi:sugar lactone lactonase YvrE